MKLLKWAGVVALVALPVMIFFKKRKALENGPAWDDDQNIFAQELEE